MVTTSHSQLCLLWLNAVFAWEAYEKGTDAHVQADPTKLELLAREFNKRKDTFIQTKKESILSKYGGEEHLNAPPKQLLLAQTVTQYSCCIVLYFTAVIKLLLNSWNIHKDYARLVRSRLSSKFAVKALLMSPPYVANVATLPC